MARGAGREEEQLFYRRVQEQVGTVPGVRSTALSYIVPISGGGMRTNVYIEGYQPKQNEDIELNTNIVSPNYFKTLNIPLVQGREFNAEDKMGAPGVVIVNEEFARRYFPGTSALGKVGRTDRGTLLEVMAWRGNANTVAARRSAAVFYPPLAQKA